MQETNFLSKPSTSKSIAIRTAVSGITKSVRDSNCCRMSMTGSMTQLDRTYYMHELTAVKGAKLATLIFADLARIYNEYAAC